MSQLLDLLAQYGPWILFLAVFLEQVGIPLPAVPWLLAAGALVGAGRIHLLPAFIAATLGAILADLLWFYLGRRYGKRLLELLCRISLEKGSCIRRTENIFGRYGLIGVVMAKFIPGLSSVAAPLAGRSGLSVFRFLLFDGFGSLLYVGCFFLGGYLFRAQLEQLLRAFENLGFGALAVLLGLIALFGGYKFFQRRQLLSSCR